MPVRLQKISTRAHGAAASRLATWTALGAAALSLFTSSAQAEEAVPQKTVRYADLDLSNAEQAKALYVRLERASKVVCRSFESKDVALRQLYQDCYENALSNAVESVDHANVTALYRSDENIRLAQRGSDSRRRG